MLFVELDAGIGFDPSRLGRMQRHGRRVLYPQPLHFGLLPMSLLGQKIASERQSTSLLCPSNL